MLGALGTHPLGAIEIKAEAVVEAPQPVADVTPVQIETAIVALKDTAEVMRQATPQGRRSIGLRIRA